MQRKSGAVSRKHLHYEYIFANICKQPTCLYSLRLHVWKDVEKEKKGFLKDISIKHKHSLSMLHTFTDKQWNKAWKLSGIWKQTLECLTRPVGLVGVHQHLCSLTRNTVVWMSITATALMRNEPKPEEYVGNVADFSSESNVRLILAHLSWSVIFLNILRRKKTVLFLKLYNETDLTWSNYIIKQKN